MDINQIRTDTPGCHDKLFFNSAGSSLPPVQVNREISEYLEEEARVGGYRMAQMKQREIAGFYHEVGLLLNTPARNIAFASSATEAYIRALSSIHFQSNDVILTTDDDYVSSFLHFLSLKKRTGIRIERIRTLENGDLDLAHCQQLIQTHSPKLVTIAHVPTSSGIVQDAEAVGTLCEEFGCTFLLDACQSVGQLPLDVNRIKCHFLSATGRKFLRGPRGTGFLYVSDKMLYENYAPLYVDLQGATWTGPETYELKKNARRFEQWEMPYALMLGLKAAIGYLNALGIEKVARRSAELSDHLRHRLESLRDTRMFDKGSHKSNIITFRKDGKSLIEHERVLQENNVYFSVVSRESARFDFAKKQVDALIRLSPHYFNTTEEIDDLVDIIAEI